MSKLATAYFWKSCMLFYINTCLNCNIANLILKDIFLKVLQNRNDPESSAKTQQRKRKAASCSQQLITRLW